MVRHHAFPLAALLVTSLAVAACGGEPETPPADATQAAPGASGEPTGAAAEPLPEGAQARSLLGEPLFPPELPDDVRATYEANLDTARRGYEAAPENADSIIWFGRRLAYLARYDSAIDVYSRGLELHPDDARLYRHRGHRYVSIRRFDEAIADFRRAVELTRGQPDEVEPDGLPNARGIPTSTLQFNIWYHLGLAHYLKGEYEQALLAWNECLAVSGHPDSVVATSYWLNNTLRRLDLGERADSLIAELPPADEIIESGSYLDVLMLHRGERTAEELLGPTGADATLASTTTGYGVGLWHFVNGRREVAYDLWEQILGNRAQWSAFGYLAAEAELAASR